MPEPELPHFKYHPDPLSTGSVVASTTECRCCQKARGYIYVGPVYAVEELNEEICPWCIADGGAHEKFEASFTDEEGIGGYGDFEEVSNEVIQEVAFRTPGFTGWQQEKWWTHCGDAAEFLGVAGKTEVEQFGPELVEELRKETGYDDEEWQGYFEELDKDDSPTAYVFHCRHCGKLGGYSDCH